MITNFLVLKDRVLEEKEIIEIDERIRVVPAIESQAEMFIDKKVIIEKLIVKKANPEYEKLLHLFQEQPINQQTGKCAENSRINFLTVNKFPDGCFYILNDSEKRLTCYICEMKHRPGDKVIEIAQQFYNGYIHCKTFFAATNLDTIYEIKFEFVIVGYLKNCEYFDHQTIINGQTKTPPGEIPAPKVELEAYWQYKAGKLFYSQRNDGENKFEFPFEFLQLNYFEESSEDEIILVHELVIENAF